jgi:tetratricopeptide (TPR) repeat protein
MRNFNIRLKLRIVLYTISLALFCGLSEPGAAVYGATNAPGESRELEYAQKLFSDEVYDIAIEQCESFRRNFPDSDRLDEILKIESESHYIQGDYEDSRRNWQRLAINHSTSRHAPFAMQQVANCLLMLNRKPEAVKTLKRLSEYYPASPYAPEALLRAAQLWGGDISQRNELLNRLIREWPAHVAALEARLILAEDLLHAGDNERASREFDTIIKIAPPGKVQVAAVSFEAELLRLSDQANQALAITTPLLKQYYDSPERGFLRCTHSALLLSVGDYSQARKQLADWISDADSLLDSPRILDSLRVHQGNAAALMGDYKEAAVIYENVVNADAAVYYRKAWCLSKDMQLAAASKSWVDVAGICLQKKTISSSELKLLACSLDEINRLNDSAAGKNIDWTEVARALNVADHVIDVPVRLIDSLIEAGEYQVAGALLSQRKLQSSLFEDELAFSTIKLATARADFRQASELTRDFKETFPISPLIPEIELFYKNNIRRHAESAGLNEKLLGFLVRQNDGVEPQKLAIEFAELYLEHLIQPDLALEQFQKAMSGPNKEATEEAHWGLIRCYLYKEDVEELKSSIDRFLKQYPGSKFGPAVLNVKHDLDYPDKENAEFLQARITELTTMFESHPDSTQRQILQENLVIQWYELAELINSKKGADSIAVMASAIQAINYSESDGIKRVLNPESILARANAMSITGNQAAADSTYRTLVSQHANSPFATSAELKLAASPLSTDAIRLELLSGILDKRYYHPAAETARQLMAGLYLRNNEAENALLIYQELLQEAERFDPDLEIIPGSKQTLRYSIALALEAAEKPHEALLMYKSFLRAAAKSDRAELALYNTARIFHQQKEDEEAIRYLKNQLIIFPDGRASEAAMKLLAEIYSEQELHQAALEVLNKLGASSTDNPEIRFHWVKSLYRSGKLTQGKTELSRLVKDFSKSIDADTVKAAMNLAKGRYLSSRANYDEALKSFNYILKKYPETRFAALAQFGLARVSTATGNEEKALEQLETLSKNWPDFGNATEAFILKGTLYRRSGDVQGAVLEFRRAVNQATDDKSRRFALNNLIVSYRELNFFDGALQAVRQYLQEFPEAEDRFSKQIETGLLLKEIGEYQQAIKHLRNLLAEADVENEAAIQFYIGECYQLDAEYSTAILEFMKVPYLGQKTRLDWDVTAIYQAGLCWESLGKFDKARDLYHKIIRLRGAGSSYGKAAQERINHLRLSTESDNG